MMARSGFQSFLKEQLTTGTSDVLQAFLSEHVDELGDRLLRSMFAVPGSEKVATPQEVVRQFILEHADEIGTRILRSIFEGAPATDAAEAKQKREIEAMNAEIAHLQRATRKLLSSKPAASKPAASSSEPTAPFEYPGLKDKVVAALKQKPPKDRESVKYRGYRPEVCIAPECGEKNRGAPTGYCCLEHAQAPAALRRAWSDAFMTEARKQIGLPPPRRLAEPQPSRKRAFTMDLDSRILGFLLSQGASGAQLEDIHQQTQIPIGQLRSRLLRLRWNNQIQTIGNTSKAAYIAVEAK
jgi:hypothetical protein